MLVPVRRRRADRHGRARRRAGDAQADGPDGDRREPSSAGGIIAPEAVKNAKPDGYTILIHHIGMATIPTLYRQLRFNPLTDFEYIGLINEVPMTIIANEKVPAKDLKEFLAYLRANKDKVSYANAGIGAASHLCGMLFMSAIQLDLLTVPYKGTGPAMNDLLGGQVTFMCDQTTTTTSQIKSGKVKAYGITSAKRVRLAAGPCRRCRSRA
jgi:tripartite-type tricarboxylate transporter receptor subunit TctC